MMFKKFAALMLVLCLVCGTVAFAEDYTLDKDNTSCGTTVTYEVKPNDTYTVIIPSGVTLGKAQPPADGTVLQGILTVSMNATGYNLNKVFVVSVKSKNGCKLWDAGHAFYIPYQVAKDGDSPIIDLPADTVTELQRWTRLEANQNPSFTLHINAKYADMVAGEYTDTLTFTVSTEDNKPVTEVGFD